MDIDHTPRHVLRPSHAPFYETRRYSDALAEPFNPGGVFALWSDDPPDEDYLAVVEGVFASCGGARRHLPEPAHRWRSFGARVRRDRGTRLTKGAARGSPRQLMRLRDGDVDPLTGPKFEQLPVRSTGNALGTSQREHRDGSDARSELRVFGEARVSARACSS